MAVELSERGYLEILAHEGVVRQTYYDSKRVPTWGVGVTDNSGHKVARYWDNPQPMKRVLEIFVWLMRTKYLPRVLEAFKGYELTEAQLAAAASFDWNTGRIHNAEWVKLWKAKQYDKAYTAFMNFRSPAEIIPRREAERDLFFKSKWVGGGTVTEYTKLKANKTPDWSSAKKVNILADLREALKSSSDQTPIVPTSPVGEEPKPEPTEVNIFVMLGQFLARLFSKGDKNAD